MFSAGGPQMLFPKYLLPSLPFFKSKAPATPNPPSEASSSSPSSSSSSAPERKYKKSKAKHSLTTKNCKTLPAGTSKTEAPEPEPEHSSLPGNIEYLKCKQCRSDICFATCIISKGFIGRHGRAYLIDHLQTEQITLHPETERPLVTGHHKVSDVACKLCENILGWKYIDAEPEDQRYKIGKFIIEREKVTRVNCWDMPRPSMDTISPPGPPPSNSKAIPVSDGYFDPIELELREAVERGDVNSEDEEELEDMFLGIWTPETAARRRKAAPQMPKEERRIREREARMASAVAIGMIDARL